MMSESVSAALKVFKPRDLLMSQLASSGSFENCFWFTEHGAILASVEGERPRFVDNLS
jgi:hypothetical protein